MIKITVVAPLDLLEIRQHEQVIRDAVTGLYPNLRDHIQVQVTCRKQLSPHHYLKLQADGMRSVTRQRLIKRIQHAYPVQLKLEA